MTTLAHTARPLPGVATLAPTTAPAAAAPIAIGECPPPTSAAPVDPTVSAAARGAIQGLKWGAIAGGVLGVGSILIPTLIGGYPLVGASLVLGGVAALKFGALGGAVGAAIGGLVSLSTR